MAKIAEIEAANAKLKKSGWLSEIAELFGIDKNMKIVNIEQSHNMIRTTEGKRDLPISYFSDKTVWTMADTSKQVALFLRTLTILPF